MYVGLFVSSIIAMILGGIVAFIGIALLKQWIAFTKTRQPQENFEQTKELTNEDLDRMSRQEYIKISPLPYMLFVEGGLVFAGSTLALVIGTVMKTPPKLWWILPVAVVVFALLSLLLDGLVLGLVKYSHDEFMQYMQNEYKFEKNVKKKDQSIAPEIKEDNVGDADKTETSNDTAESAEETDHEDVSTESADEANAAIDDKADPEK